MNMAHYLESDAGGWDLVGADNSTDLSGGKCSAPGVDPDLHFPLTDGNPRPYSAPAEAQIAEAKRMCAGCPVITKCRVYGFTQPFGVWGGMDEDDRRVLRAKSKKQSKPVEELLAEIAAATPAPQVVISMRPVTTGERLRSITPQLTGRQREQLDAAAFVDQYIAATSDTDLIAKGA